MTRRQSSDVRMARQDAPQPPMAMQVTILHIARTAGREGLVGPRRLLLLLSLLPVELLREPARQMSRRPAIAASVLGARRQWIRASLHDT